MNMSDINKIYNKLADTFFFRVYDEKKKEWNGEGKLTPDNWGNKKDIFFKQRLEIYKSSYTYNEKIELELQALKILTINNNDYKILKKRYKNLLKSKLKDIKNLKKNLLPDLEKLIIIHYGCSDFSKKEVKLFWVGAISNDGNKSYFFENENEIKIIERLRDFVQSNQNKIFIHWSMNKPNFGFKAIQRRYFDLTNKEIDLTPINDIDLSEFLKNKYGINYVPRENSRLNNLAGLNGFSGFQSEIEVINTFDATNRLELIYSIVQAEIQGQLKVMESQAKSTIKSTEGYQSKYWFKVGLLFATGEMDKLLKNHNRNATKIANILGNKNYRPYISDSLGFNKESDKNIFNSRDKMIKIINHCKTNDITIIPKFSGRLPLQ